jgi:hypothetical protein
MRQLKRLAVAVGVLAIAVTGLQSAVGTSPGYAAPLRVRPTCSPSSSARSGPSDTVTRGCNVNSGPTVILTPHDIASRSTTDALAASHNESTGSTHVATRSAADSAAATTHATSGLTFVGSGVLVQVADALALLSLAFLIFTFLRRRPSRSMP